MLTRALSLITVALLWLLHFLPLPILSVLGRALGTLLYVSAGRRRRIAEINLRLCFPEMDDTQRAKLARTNFQALGRSILDRGILWWGSQERILPLIKVVGEEKISTLLQARRPVILLAVHFVGLDAGAMAMAMRFDLVTIYAPQRNAVFERVFYKGRRRFGNQLMLTRRDGVRPVVKAMKAGRPFYYFSDMDLGRRDSVFAPLFGVQAATITGLSRLSRAAGASVVPCVTRMLPSGEGYVVDIGDPWPSFPTDDVDADTVRMNFFIESIIRTMPEQYFWFHRRFKTRPKGEYHPYRTT